jgi:hypothetical protein
MAINFLNSINLNQNELIKAQVENQPNDAAAGTGVEGQLYYDTTLDVLKVWAGGVWKEVGGGVISLTAGTYLTNSGTSADPIINHDLTSRTDTTSTDAPAFGGTFEAVTGVTTNTTGHITAIDVSTVTIPASPTITLTGEVTGSGTTSILTTVANNVLDVDNFNASAIVTAAEGIENNDNDTTLPTSAAVKAYADSLIVGGLIYQGGYDAATNTPDLDSSPSASIKKGWTYTVTADGLFFTEQVRVGDVLIAEQDAPTTLANWTTVQNNVDLADLTTVGIGNVNAGTGISVTYSSGTATVANTDTNTSNTTTGTIAAGSLSGTVTHAFGINTIVQTINANGDTVFCDVTRTPTTSVATISAVEATNITILVQKIG